MRFVVQTEPGVVEFNWMWAPTFIGMDNNLKKKLEKELGSELEGKPATDEVLDWAHDRVIDIICKHHHALPGLRDYLDSLKFVGDV
jgi:hypothetical protein